jgi:hypothetical protein
MNKYANEYLNSLLKSVKEYKPFNPNESMSKGLPIGAMAGAGAGALIGGLSQSGDPGYDEEGNKKSRLKQILKGMAVGGVTGGAVGGLGAAAMPSIGQFGLNKAKDINLQLDAKANSGNDTLSKLKSKLNPALIQARYGFASQVLPHMNVEQLTDTAKYHIDNYLQSKKTK